jgi:predicted nucleic acid-binding protein
MARPSVRDLLRTETVRALRRSGNHHLVGQTRRMFGAINPRIIDTYTSTVIVRLDGTLLDRAGDLGPLELRSLDAMQLAAALFVGSDLAVVLTYDIRLRDAALAQGLPSSRRRPDRVDTPAARAQPRSRTRPMAVGESVERDRRRTATRPHG